MELKPKGVSKIVSSTVSDLLRTELFKLKIFRVIERSEMKTILKEQEFQLSGCTETECAVEVGRLLSVKKILIGTIGKLGKKYIINARIVDVGKGEVEFAENVSAYSEEDLEGAVIKYAVKLGRKIEGISLTIDTVHKETDLRKKINQPKKPLGYSLFSDDWQPYRLMKNSQEIRSVKEYKFNIKDNALRDFIEELIPDVEDGDECFNDSEYSDARKKYFSVLKKIESKLVSKEKDKIISVINNFSGRYILTFQIEFNLEISRSNDYIKEGKYDTAEKILSKIINAIDSMSAVYRIKLADYKKLAEKKIKIIDIIQSMK